MARKKVLLMGKAHSGKTSMRSIIFANYLARDTMRLSPTLDVEHTHVRFLGDLVLNLWDCGGQDAFYESYFERDRETIFRSVELLIYVFDIASECPEKDFEHFAGVLDAIEENSPDARIFVLVHKMDLVAKEEQEMILDDRRRLIEESCIGCGVHNFQCFGTSIWDETLYKAWSEIVRYLIPNIAHLQTHLDGFCRVCDADEVVLFEKATFLVISHSSNAGAGTSDADANGSGNVITAAGDHAHAVIKDGVDNDNADGNIDHGTAAENNYTEEDEVETGIEGATANASASDLTDGTPAADAHLNGNLITDGNVHDDSYGSDSINPAPISNVPTDDANDNYSEVTTEKDLDSALNQTLNTAANDRTVATGPSAGGNQHPNADQTAQNELANGNSNGNGGTAHFDTHRFEKISNIVKQFKLSCEKAQSQFQGMEVSNSHFKAYIDAFTANTYIMVIVSDPNVRTAATLMNIKNARRHFERFIPRS